MARTSRSAGRDVPLPRPVLGQHRLLFVLLKRNDIVEELKHVLKLLELPQLFLAEVLELTLILLRGTVATGSLSYMSTSCNSRVGCARRSNVKCVAVFESDCESESVDG